jgi:hypothetical protein
VIRVTRQDEEQFDTYLALLKATGRIDAVIARWPEMSNEAREALEMAAMLYSSPQEAPPHRLRARQFIGRLEERQPPRFAQVFSWLMP